MAVKKSELYSMLFEACNKLRGGVEPARYKDYVLILLFFKYVSDRYKGETFGEFQVEEGASFDDLIAIKNTPNVGEQTDIIISKFLAANGLQGSLPEVSFNNHDELGSGKELIDKVSGLIGVFENPAIDFKANRASGDDIIGDAYEYFMMKFAQDSGKSKGQFYTPSEVSRVIARLIGIGNIEYSPNKKYTLYDPAAGSGSLLIRAADEAPRDANGKSIVTIFAQEKDNSTAGLAKMNFVLHQKGEGVIKRGNTLSNPQYLNHEKLRQFDFIVMNPPFSDKSWSDGVNPADDKYDRFDGYGIPPAKKGDYAWMLHVIKSLNSEGRAGIILPHGVLFRGDAEAIIRKHVIEKHYIEGIISLPPNLFYGTGIPACIIIIDKKDASTRDGVFLIDASQGFKKDGSKNRLREQDIEKIVRTYLSREEVPGFSCFVTYKDVLEKNDGNLNISRYIQRPSNVLSQNIAAHLNGGIPKSDINTLETLWEVSPNLKNVVFSSLDTVHETYHLALPSRDIETTIKDDGNIQSETEYECGTLFSSWAESVKSDLLNIASATDPKVFIRHLSGLLIGTYSNAVLIDAYDAYDCLLNYWNEKLQDDVYIIKVSSYEAARLIDYEYKTKKTKNAAGDTVIVPDKAKVKSFEGSLIPRDIIEGVYFAPELDAINTLQDASAALDSVLDEMREEESGEEGLLVEVLNEKGDSIPKTNLNKRIKELKPTKGTAVSSSDKDEYDALIAYKDELAEKEKLDKEAKQLREELNEKVTEKYRELTVEEIKSLLFDKKWMPAIQSRICDVVNANVHALSSQLLLIANRYEHTLSEIDLEVYEARKAASKALERMGYVW